MPKNVLHPCHAVVAGSLAGNLTSPVTDIRYLDDVAIQLIWAGTPAGTFAVQGSLDYDAATHNAGTWTAITLSVTPTAAGTDGNALIDLALLSFPYIRVVYTRTGGTGTLEMYISAKGV